jgi:ABC-type antimicrobial peptide transport system permease subunit
MIVAAIMAIGGVFGIMNTMFAAISQRTRDIGVMRILGFKRWQVLVSFMLESLVIALVGGLVGVAIGTLADGFTATSILSGGAGGGGKFVVLRMSVGADLMLLGVVFTLAMGRLGGLVPALSAMRLGILDSLR